MKSVENVLACAVMFVMLQTAPTSFAFAANTQLPTAAGFTPSQLSVSEGGSANYRIPIQVPPGIASMEPKLELAYNSQGCAVEDVFLKIRHP